MAPSGTRVRVQRPRSALVFVEDTGLGAIVEELLVEEGWEVFAVEDIADARTALEALAPGVLVVDCGLHVEQLEAFVGELGARRSAPAVVVLSDLATAATIAAEHQVVFVREPFDLEEFVIAVEEARRLGARPRRSAQR